MRKIVFGLFLIMAGCNSASTENNMKQKNDDRDTVNIISQQPVDTLKMQDNRDDTTVNYEYTNDTLSQSLALNYTSKHEISFKITSVNKTKNKTSTLTGAGRAHVKLNQDPEMDEDDEGNAYTTIEYHYVEGDCSLSIRIAMDTKDKAKIFEYNCDKFHDNDCPFASIGVLKKVQK